MMKNLFTILMVILSVHHFTNGAKILGIVPTPSYSHQVAFRSLWTELSLKGHTVVVMTTDPMNNPALTNLTEIDLSFSYDFMKRENISEILIGLENDFVQFVQRFIVFQGQICEEQLMHKNFQNFLKQNQTFDVVLVEVFFPEMLALGEIFKAPTILISSLGITNRLHQLMGNPAHPILYPDVLLPFFGRLSLTERLTAVFFHTYSEYVILPKSAEIKEKLLSKYFPNVTKSLPELCADVDMVFVNDNPILYGVRPVGPTTIAIGGGAHINEPQPLSKDLQDFLDKETNGVIYFSLGSNVKSKHITGELRKTILETLKALPFKVLWKFEDLYLEGKPDNVKIIQWAPQQDVLRHPNVKLFITQGGLQSMEEAIYANVPMVVLPFFGDQARNAKNMEQKKIAIKLDKKSVSIPEFTKAILDVVEDLVYLENIKKLAQLSLDEPMTGTEKGVWWTEYVIRHKGAEDLRNLAVEVPFYQFLFVDIIAILSAIILVIILMIRCTCNCVKSKLFIDKNKKIQ